MNEVYPTETLPDHTFSESRTPEYWAGCTLAQYQWTTAKRFKDIFDRIPLSEIISMYPTFHEMDISRFIESLNRRYNEFVAETKLHEIRKSRQMSQSELAKLSGVNIRSIQLNEQRVNDIDNA